MSVALDAKSRGLSLWSRDRTVVHRAPHMGVTVKP